MSDLIQRLNEKVNSKQYVIWDFDGVIFSLDWYSNGFYEKFCDDKLNLLQKYDPNILKKFGSVHGPSYFYQTTDYLTKEFGEEARQAFNEFYLVKEIEAARTGKFNYDVVECIKDSRSNIQHFIWSNNQSKVVIDLLKKADIYDRFTAIVGLDISGVAKPNLEGFGIIKQSINDVSPIESLFVGDSLNTDAICAEKLDIEFFYFK